MNEFTIASEMPNLYNEILKLREMKRKLKQELEDARNQIPIGSLDKWGYEYHYKKLLKIFGDIQ